MMLSAQEMVGVSNLLQAPTGSAAIGSDSWIAQQFYIFPTETNTYTLNSIQLLLNSASGSPDGFAVSIYSGSLNDLGNLSGSTDPSAGGIFIYAASGITLFPGNNYYVVVSAATPIAQGAYDWSATQGTANNGNWVINDIY